MNEVIREFLIETHENLAQLDLDLVTLEKDPNERETLGRAFRTLHTIKGTAGFLGLQKLQAVAHAAENLLSQMRDGKLLFDVEIASALLAGVDAIRQMLEAVEADETDGQAEFSAVIATLDRMCTARAGAAAPASVAVLERTAVPASIVARASLPPQSTGLLASEPSAEGVESRVTAVSDSSIRVDVGLLDKLMTLVGELVLARNQIVQYGAVQEDTAFVGTVQHLNLLTSELQAGVMKTRMQPIGNLWSKFPRAVRDLAVACNKQARLDMDGQETELDKTIIEALRDPLTHLVRNAIDHGIEAPAERLARGKPAEGRLALHAFHEGGKVIIEIADDGGGIDPQKVRAKAIRARLLDAAQADSLNERELLNLVFLPGFSTAEQVSQFSGRGVGMDVVRTNVEKIGGTVSIDSEPGRGTTVRMKIPLTLAIIPALTIRSGDNRYAIPQVNVVELVCLEGARAQRALEHIHGAPVYRLRGNLLPLVYLDRQLGAEPSPREVVNMVVLQADERQFGLIVDAIHDTEEIVVKPLSPLLKGIGLFAGATIMGDGKVALILDVLGLAQHANVVSGTRERSLSEKRGSAVEAAQDRQALLLFASNAGGRMAIPLSLVARLEVFPRSALEKLGPHDVIQYRGAIMPLVHVARILERLARDREMRGGLRGAFDDSIAAADDAAPLEVVVYAAQGRHVGLVVEHIIDIVEQSLPARSPAQRPGVLFTAVVQGRATEILNVEEIFGWIDRDFAALPLTSGVEV